MFAVQEVPQASMRFYPFELQFGRNPLGVLDLVKENWQGSPRPSKNKIQYVLDLRAKLHTLGKHSGHGRICSRFRSVNSACTTEVLG